MSEISLTADSFTPGKIVDQRILKALTIDNEFDQKILDIIYSVTFNRGKLPIQDYDFTNCFGDSKVLAIIAAPKSGSTFLYSVLQQIIEFSYFNIAPADFAAEPDVDIIKLCLAKKIGNVISRTHTKGTPRNAEYLQQFSIKPIVTIRNIYDTVISLAKELRAYENLENYGVFKGIDYSFIWSTCHQKNLSMLELYDLVIDTMLPWYINFYVSWIKLEQHKQISIHWVQYEKLMQDKFAIIADILKQFNLEVKNNKFDDLFNTFYRNNEHEHDSKGINPIGVGKELLTKMQVTKIDKMLGYFADVDFFRYTL